MPRYAIHDLEPTLADTAWAAPSADLIGDVRLAEGASVWFGVVIRADNTPIIVGARSNVQENSVLHSDPGFALTIGEDCTVGHQAMLHGCTLGNRVLIGMGATILNGAVIPDDCIVGAGALVTEGKTFEPGSLIVGAPARVVRALDDTARAGLRMSAAHYADRSADYAASLRRID